MKRILFYAASFLLAASFVACNSETDEVTALNETLKVSAGMGGSSRTMLGSDARTVTWYEGDRIYLFDADGQSSSIMTLNDGAGQRTATFSGTVNGELSKLDKSLYPKPDVDGNELSFGFSAERSYSENSAAPMVGVFSPADKHVTFSNLCALVRVGLADQEFNGGSILTLTMNGQQCITGKAVVDVAGGRLVMNDGGNTVTVKDIPADTRYVDIPVPAGTYSGYTVEINGTAIRSSEESKDLGVDDALVIGDTEGTVEYVAFSTEILESGDMEVDYAVLGSDGLGYLYEFQEENPQLPKRFTIWDGSKQVESEESVELEVNFNDQGLPTNIISSDFTIVLGNHSGNTFDAFVVLTTGESEIYEGLELQDDMTWESYLAALNNTGSRAPSRNPRLGPINLAVNGVGCAISVAAAIVGTPTVVGTAVGWGLATLSCGSALAAIANQMEWIDTSSMPGNIIASFATLGSCATISNPLGWASCAVGAIGTITGWIDQWLNDRQEDIQLGNGALISGNGDVKITLTWDKPGDIDLHCWTPSGAHIFYGDKHPQGTNGWLDFDNIPGFPDCNDPENIFFEPAAPGTYDVKLHYYGEKKGVRSVNYRVVVLINGTGRTYTGTITGQGTYVDILTFTIGESTSRSIPTFKPVVWDWNELPAKN